MTLAYQASELNTNEHLTRNNGMIEGLALSGISACRKKEEGERTVLSAFSRHPSN